MADDDNLGPGKGPHLIRILYEAPVVPDREAIERELAQRLLGVGDVSVSAPDDRGTVAVHFPDTVTVDEGQRRASLAWLTGPCAPIDPRDARQSWTWSEARAVVPRATFAIGLSEMTTMLLPAHLRARCLVTAAAAISAAHPPLAIHWARLERFDSPATFEDEVPSAAFHLVNYRSAKTSDGDLVMDTLGASLLGLIDLQLHFRDLDTHDVRLFLFQRVQGALLTSPCPGLAVAYPLEDRQVIDGPSGSPATCRLEMSLVPPRRGIIDIDPGPPFSAR